MQAEKAARAGAQPPIAAAEVQQYCRPARTRRLRQRQRQRLLPRSQQAAPAETACEHQHEHRLLALHACCQLTG